MKYGYARVSTAGQNLTAQIQDLKAEGCDKIYSEHFTGTKKERPEFQKVLNDLKPGDTLAVCKLDRFARSARDAIDIIEKLFQNGVRVHVLNMGIVEDTPTGRLIFNIMSSFAQFERDMIVERTQEGKAIARQREDFREGRPKKFNKDQRRHALQLLNSYTYTETERMTGISRSTLVRIKQSSKAGKQ